MNEFGAEREAPSLPKGSICSASVDLIQDSNQAISSYVAASLNVVLFITATVGNILILTALSHQESTLHAQSRLLFRCLATTDLGVGVISQPLFVIQVVSASTNHGHSVLSVSVWRTLLPQSFVGSPSSR